MKYWRQFVPVLWLMQIVQKAGACPSGHIEFNSSCYHFVHDEKSWHKARDFCIDEGGYLAEINSPSENAFIKEEATKRLSSSVHFVGYWIGGFCKEIRRTWKWERSGNAIVTSYWAPYEPSNVAESCISISKYLGFLWNDCYCTEKSRFICEDELCQGDSIEFNSSCYTFIDNQPKSWHNAKSFCKHAGGYLAEVTSAEENAFLVSQITVRSAGVYDTAYWIGGLCTNTERIWIWNREDETIVDSYWAPHQPNKLTHDCILLPYLYDFLWDDYYCSNKFYFVCEGEQHFETTEIAQSTQTSSKYDSTSPEVINTESESTWSTTSEHYRNVTPGTEVATYDQHRTATPAIETSTNDPYITTESVTEDSRYDEHTTNKPATERSTNGQYPTTTSVTRDPTYDQHTTTEPWNEISTNGQYTDTNSATGYLSYDQHTTTRGATEKTMNECTTTPDTNDKTHFPVTLRREATIICKNVCVTDETMEELQAAIKKLRLLLIIHKNATSIYRRSLISAPDNRISARSLGHIGAVVLLIVTFLIIAMDVERIMKFRSMSCSKRRKRKNLA